jgi:hypothetical protein
MSDEASRVKLLVALSPEARMLLKNFIMEADPLHTALLVIELMKRMCLRLHDRQVSTADQV